MKGGFETDGRPNVLAKWMKNGRKYDQVPKSITDLAVFEETFLDWWVLLQPEARRVQDVDTSQKKTLLALLIKPTVVEDGGWNRLAIGGKKGIFFVFMMLAWYKRLAKTARHLTFFELAIDDVSWALGRVLRDLETRKRTAAELEDAVEGTLEQANEPRKKQRYESNSIHADNILN